MREGYSGDFLRRRVLPMALIVLALAAGACRSKGTQTASSQALLGGRLPDTLRVGTLYSPSSYFLYREEPMGFDYEKVRQFAADHSMPLELVVAGNISELMELLRDGKVDLLAYSVPVTDEYGAAVRYCGETSVSKQVLVQPAGGSGHISDVTQLRGRTVWVEQGSRYEQRLRHLDQELGGGIVIRTLQKDTLIADDMIEMVSSGKIPLTVVGSDVAGINAPYFPDIEASVEVGVDQQASWAVRSGDYALAEAVDSWSRENATNATGMDLYKKYFELSKAEETQFAMPGVVVGGGHLSPYDAYFRAAGAKTDIDWRLLAAIGYVESRFDNSQVSWAGARGVMQLMPGTARALGLTAAQMEIPAHNIDAAARLVKQLNGTFAEAVPNPAERMKFILAAYNAGHAHILDAIALARKYGLNPAQWEGSVAQMALKKNRPEYYNDPVVKYGYFRGRETVAFVDHVMKVYNYYKAQTI